MARSRQYTAETRTDADDPALQDDFLLLSLEKAAEGTGFYVNTNKKRVCFKQDGAISILYGKLLTLVDKFSY